MELVSSVFSSFLSYIPTALSIGGMVMAMFSLQSSTVKADKKLKQTAIASIVLFGVGLILPFVSALWMIAAALLAVNDMIAIQNVLGSTVINVVLTVLSTAMKIVSFILSLTVAVKVKDFENKKQEPSAGDPQMPDAEMSSEQQEREFAAERQSNVEDKEGYMPVSTFLILWFFTLGAGYMIWIYRMTGYLNRMMHEEHPTPLSQMLLCGFVPFYSIFWFNKYGKKLETLLQINGSNENISTLCTVLGIFCPLAAGLIMQDHCNKVIRN
ncbi:MAG: DUF4234 domain-containing protein [Ruminococcaceae bacterium]|nr:DUF4234 domain-containing protein [Oscillospiraceae bacterium]